MSFINRAVLIVSIFFFFSYSVEKVSTRVVKTINADWTFNYFPSGKLDKQHISANFDDSKWPAIALPHTWSTYETTGDIHPFIKYPSEKDDTYWWYGWGIYRKKIRIDQSLKNKEIYIELDGVQKYCKLFLNGNFIGDHKGGFTSFYFRLTDFIDWGKDNIIAVAVNGRRNDTYRIPPMTAGNWDVYSGIYRDVRLVAKSKVHFPFQGSYKHEGGFLITTPQVSEQTATVHIKSFLKNSGGNTATGRIVHQIISPDGQQITELESEFLVLPNELKAIEIQSNKIKEPKLWSPDSPNLYKVVSTIFANGRIQDEIVNPLGFRYFHWDYENDDLYVNGKILNIKGTNRHQEYPWLGDANPNWIAKMDFEDIKYNLGHNFMRLTHYPNDKYLYNLADTMGIIMVGEVPNIKSIDFDESVQEQNVREMIRRDRNHPSIFFWSVGNETSDAADSKWVVEEDTTRIVHARKCDDGSGDFVQHDHTNLDMENLLRVTIRGWFASEDAPAGFSSEPKNGQHSSNETWQHQMAQVRGGSIRGLIGDNCITWLYQDHGADREYLNCILKHINPKGCVDMFRQPKYVYWLTKALYTEIPTVFIHPHFWREKYIGQLKNITIDSNCDEVELFVNGNSQGKQYPKRENFFSLKYENVAIENGELKLVGTRDGKMVETFVNMPGEPRKLVLSTGQKQIIADRSGIAIVKANILDKNDHPVFDATNTINWKVDGPAKLVGHSVYETDIMKHEEWEGTGYTVVPVCNVIRTTNRAGKIKVTVSSPGLKPASIEIESIEPVNISSPFKEYKLLDDGRLHVQKNEAYSRRIELVNAIYPIRENHRIVGETQEGLAQNLSRFVRERNHGFETGTVGFKTFIKVLADKLSNQDGQLIADDYNFLVEQFNTWFAVQQIVNASSITEKEKSKELNKYAIEIIRNAKPVDLKFEKEKWSKR